MSDAIEMYSTGRGYVQSSFAMMASVERLSLPNDTTFFLGFHMLIGFATELYLKSYLLTVGMTEKELRAANIRHDLEALWKEAVGRGFPDTSVYPLVTYLHAAHKNFEFRYMSSVTKYTAPPPLHVLFDLLTRLDNAADTACCARASRGLPQGPGWAFPLDRTTWRM